MKDCYIISDPFHFEFLDILFLFQKTPPKAFQFPGSGKKTNSPSLCLGTQALVLAHRGLLNLLAQVTTNSCISTGILGTSRFEFPAIYHLPAQVVGTHLRVLFLSDLTDLISLLDIPFPSPYRHPWSSYPIPPYTTCMRHITSYGHTYRVTLSVREAWDLLGNRVQTHTYPISTLPIYIHPRVPIAN